MELVKSITTPDRPRLRLRRPVARRARFLRGIAEGKILGQRCPSAGSVYVPPRGACPRCAVPTEEEVEVADKGTVTTFCIVRVPSENLTFDAAVRVRRACCSTAPTSRSSTCCRSARSRTCAWACACEAVWAPKAELAPTHESIRYFQPIGEPDAPYDSYKEHL